jgi:RNA polymerase sigma factor (sigma-70 family)
MATRVPARTLKSKPRCEPDVVATRTAARRDRATLDPEREQILRERLPKAYTVAKGWAKQYPHLLHDFLSAAGVGLWKAIADFVPRTEGDRWNGLWKFAVRRIRWMLTSCLQKSKAYTLPRDSCKPTGPILVTVTCHHPGPDKVAEALDDVRWLYRKLAQLSPQRRELMELYLQGVSLSDIARARGVDSSTPCYQFWKAMEELGWHRTPAPAAAG